MQTEFPVTPTKDKRDWSAIRGEASVYVLALVVMGLIPIGVEVIDLLHKSIATMARVEQRMNADSRIIQIAIQQVDPERKRDIEAIEREYAPH